MVILSVCLFALALAEDPLRAVLKSPKASLKLYRQFKESHHHRYSEKEDRLRFRLFLDSARHVAEYNEDKEDTGHYGINFFSDMTKEEKKRYLGLNVTGILPEQHAANQDHSTHLLQSTEPKKSKVLWTNKHYVTKVKDQKSCGACWAFGAVAALETRYKIQSGILRSFSEQEYLDCTYENQSGRDGCKGGNPIMAYYWSVKNGGRLAANKDNTYKERDNKCRASTTRDGMIAAKLVDYRRVGHTEEAHLEELQNGAIACSVEVTDKFFAYDGSIMKDTSCEDTANHLVAMVGYTDLFILIKNSWGREWGDRGFIRLARNHDNCFLYGDSYVPVLRATGQSDSNPDPAVFYRPPMGTEKACFDNNPAFCRQYRPKKGSKCYWFGMMAHYMMINCQRTCGLCHKNHDNNNGGKCPGGTVRCNDGKCRHQHMCH